MSDFFCTFAPALVGRHLIEPDSCKTHIGLITYPAPPYNILCILSCDFKNKTKIINNFMQTIKLKRGLDIPFEGTAAETLGSVRRPEVFHIVPDQFAGITPKLDVKVGDRVKAGSPLFHDKAFESLFFTSPVSGERVKSKRSCAVSAVRSCPSTSLRTRPSSTSTLR